MLRLCILNHTSTAADVEAVLAFLETAEPVTPPVEYERDPAVPETVPLFARLTPEEEDAFRSLSTLREVANGVEIVHRWDTSRDFFVLERGLVDVVREGEVVATLRCGDYFGEIGALEWGAGFARSRVATVVAREDVRACASSSGEALARLLGRVPAARGRDPPHGARAAARGPVSASGLRRADPDA